MLVTIETKSDDTFRGFLVSVEDCMNCRMSNVVLTRRDGSRMDMEQVFIPGRQIRFAVLPSVLEQAPVFERVRAAKEGRQLMLGLRRGRYQRAEAMQGEKGHAAAGPRPRPPGPSRGLRPHQTPLTRPILCVITPLPSQRLADRPAGWAWLPGALCRPHAGCRRRAWAARAASCPRGPQWACTWDSARPRPACPASLAKGFPARPLAGRTPATAARPATEGRPRGTPAWRRDPAGPRACPGRAIPACTTGCRPPLRPAPGPPPRPPLPRPPLR